jgi:V8-like Glu-specific endopeptidase
MLLSACAVGVAETAERADTPANGDDIISKAEESVLYCGTGRYSQLTANPGKPYNAVGYLNNGCTAFLIDADHIAAASHCFDNYTTGAWQTGLRFYPNFHPSRVTATNKGSAPRADVVRAVVNTRVSAGMNTENDYGWDWGIARVQNWQNVSGLDLTPVALAATVPTAENTVIENPAYSRHHHPYNDNDSVTWDNMQWDTRCADTTRGIAGIGVSRFLGPATNSV